MVGQVSNASPIKKNGTPFFAHTDHEKPYAVHT